MYLSLIMGFVLFAVVSSSSGCSGSTPVPAEVPLIRVGWGSWPGWYPIVLVKELGLDIKHGVRIEPIFNQAIIDGNNDWEMGKYEAALTDFDQVVRQNSQKPGFAKVILIADRSGGDTLVALPEIKTIADLKGKRVGTILGATYGELMVRRMLTAHGLAIEDVELVNVDGTEVLQAMPKIIDAGVTWEPHLQKSKEKGFNPLYSSSEDMSLPLSSVLMIRTDVIQAHPEAVKGLVAAWFEAVALWRADPVKYSSLVAKVVGGTPEEIAQSESNFIMLDQNIEQFTTGSIVQEAEVTADFLITTGQLNRAPDIKSLFDASFLKP